MGVCTGVTSLCALAGYAMESKYDYQSSIPISLHLHLVPRCHLGKVIKYDTVSKFGWSVGVLSHSIDVVIKNVLDKPWETLPDGTIVKEVPVAEEEVDCIVWRLSIHSVRLNRSDTLL